MYSENFKAKKISFGIVIAAVAVAFCLLSLPEWLGMEQFSGIYEIIVILAASFALLTFIRRSFYEYTYIINEDNITVCLRIGMKESVI